MAVKELGPAKSKLTVKQKFIYTFIGVLFVVVSVCCMGVKISNTHAIADYEKQIADIQQKAEVLNAENKEYASVLSSSDRSAYYEKIAREVYGYAKPGEYVFYKTES